MELTMKERQKLTRLTAKQYRKARKREKSKILDTFIDQTGYQRKYAIHILANEGKTVWAGTGVTLKAAHQTRKKRVYRRVYDEDVKKALIPIWEAFNYQCGKLFAPFLRLNIDRIAAEPQFACPAEVLEKLKTISGATIDRLLRKTKRQMRIKGTAGTRPAPTHLKAMVPIMTHFECVQAGSGLWQIDLVQHDGGNPGGEFCYTLTITELTHCWTIHCALKNKAFRWVYQALDDALTRLPLPVLILHSDNGGEFINHAIVQWCVSKNIGQSRSRTDKKNDNCFVEQKNGATVRKIVGYSRLCGDKGVAALTAVYDHYDRLLNFFYPCQKLLSKTRNGTRVSKKYDRPKTPFARILEDLTVPDELKQKLSGELSLIDLMAEMALMQKGLDLLPALADPVPEFLPGRALKPLLIKAHG